MVGGGELGELPGSPHHGGGAEGPWRLGAGGGSEFAGQLPERRALCRRTQVDEGPSLSQQGP